jgi:hypothetical protein
VHRSEALHRVRDTRTSSLPGLTRQSIRFEKILLRRMMDARVIPDQVEDGRPRMTLWVLGI